MTRIVESSQFTAWALVFALLGCDGPSTEVATSDSGSQADTPVLTDATTADAVIDGAATADATGQDATVEGDATLDGTSADATPSDTAALDAGDTAGTGGPDALDASDAPDAPDPWDTAACPDWTPPDDTPPELDEGTGGQDPPGMCLPCKTAADCQTAGAAPGLVCTDLGAAGHYCLVACASGADCPTATHCTGGACHPSLGQCFYCSELAVAAQTTTACTRSNVHGTCTGTVVCEHALSNTSCPAPVPAAEACNGADDDCDGNTDEGTLCDDANACTADSCTGGTCMHTSAAGPCDDGDPCTVGDACQGGACVGSPKECDDGDSCTSEESCIEGACAAAATTCACATDADCGDGSSCTLDLCLASGVCQHVPVQDGTPCDDGKACTAGEACKAGACTGGLPPFFERAWGGAKDDVVHGIAGIPGGFILAGTTESFGGGHTDAWVVRVDHGGNAAWQKTYAGTKPQDFDAARAVVGFEDGGFAFAGSTEPLSGPQLGWIVRADPDGEVIWQIASEAKGDGGAFRALLQTQDGLIAAGSTQGDAWLMRVSAEGQVVGQSSIFGGDGVQHPVAIAAVSGGTLVAGNHVGVGSARPWLARTDAAGEPLWQHAYPTEGEAQTVGGVAVLPDGGAVLAGRQGSEMWVLRVTCSGEPVWSGRYGTGEARAVVALDDGGVLAVGRGSFDDARGLRLHPDGGMAWSRPWPAASDLHTALELPDGTLALAGARYGVEGGGYNGWLIRTDAQGLMPCQKQ